MDDATFRGLRDRHLDRHELVTIGIFGTFVTGLLVAEVVVDYEPRKLTALFVFFAWLPLVAIHELGHAFCAKLLGWRVCQVVIGYGPRLGNLRILGLEVEFRLFPLEGFVLPAPRTLRGVRWKSSLIYLAGPGVELLLVLLCWLAVGETLYASTEEIPLLALQQKLHRRKPDFAIPQPIEQMNNDRRHDKRSAAEHECRIQKV